MCNKCGQLDFYKLTFEALEVASKEPNGRYIRRRTRKLQGEVQTILDKQKSGLLKEIKKLMTDEKRFLFFSKKKLKKSDLKNIFKNIEDDEDLIDTIIENQKDTMFFSANATIRKNNLSKIGIAFNLENPLAEKFISSDMPLALSKLKDTTKDHIRPILIDAIETGKSYSQVSKEISENYVFDRVRSHLIAVNETRRAYQFGGYVPLLDAKREGYKVLKKWETIGDDRVTEECDENEQDGWIDIEEEFSSGDLFPPREGNPRCRCHRLDKIEMD